MELARQYASSTQSSSSLEKTIQAVIAEIPKWSLSNCVPRILELCKQCKDMKRVQQSKASVDPVIRQQTAQFVSIRARSAWSVPLEAYVLANIAMYVNQYQADTGMGVGKGVKSLVYDDYVKSEYEDDSAYAAENVMVLKSKRDQWLKRKATEDRILTLINEFGLGILLCIPKDITAKGISAWTKPRVFLLVQGLRNTTEADAFRQICRLLTAPAEKYLLKNEPDEMNPDHISHRMISDVKVKGIWAKASREDEDQDVEDKVTVHDENVMYDEGS